jgi:membrane protease YdiL (CAAX protease family)
MHTEADWRARRSLIVAGAVGLGLLWTTFSGPLLRSLLPATGIPYARSVMTNVADLAAMSLAVGLAARAGPRQLFGLVGLAAPIARPLMWAGAIFLPAGLAAAFLAPVARDFTGQDLFWKGVGFPLFEEIIYRGLAVGALIRWAGWRWWAAALAPAVMFGLVHAGQGSGMGEIAGIVAITGLGGLLFGWLFVRWGLNLWPPILLHAGMNSLWIVFALGDNAIGGWLGNGLRIAIVVGAVLLTWRAAPPREAKTGSMSLG